MGFLYGLKKAVNAAWDIQSGGSPVHLSYRRARAMDLGLHKIQLLVVTSPIEDLARNIEEFQPDYIHPYLSIAALLPQEQLEGRLNIRPKYLLTGAEITTGNMRDTIREAWGINPYVSYSATEGIACSECSLHRGVHLYEDLCITEIVDDNNQPVPDGSPGIKVLLINLYQFGERLIRYELSDMLTIDPQPCKCGSPFRRIKSIQGRSADIMYMKGIEGGIIPVHPLHFHVVMEEITDVKEYQITLGNNAISVYIVPKPGWQNSESIVVAEKIKSMTASLKAMTPKVSVKTVEKIERDPDMMGKLVMIASNKTVFD